MSKYNWDFDAADQAFSGYPTLAANSTEPHVTTWYLFVFVRDEEKVQLYRSAGEDVPELVESISRIGRWSLPTVDSAVCRMACHHELPATKALTNAVAANWRAIYGYHGG